MKKKINFILPYRLWLAIGVTFIWIGYMLPDGGLKILFYTIGSLILTIICTLIFLESTKIKLHDNGQMKSFWIFQHDMRKIKYSLRFNTVIASLLVPAIAMWQIYQKTQINLLTAWHPVWLWWIFPILMFLFYLVTYWLRKQPVKRYG
ncbi:hypothetical protein ACFL1A_01215 [Patescibacteria group bacterium]